MWFNFKTIITISTSSHSFYHATFHSSLYFHSVPLPTLLGIMMTGYDCLCLA